MHVIVLWGLGASLITLALSLKRKRRTKVLSVAIGVFFISLGAYFLTSA